MLSSLANFVVADCLVGSGSIQTARQPHRPETPPRPPSPIPFALPSDLQAPQESSTSAQTNSIPLPPLPDSPVVRTVANEVVEETLMGVVEESNFHW